MGVGRVIAARFEYIKNDRLSTIVEIYFLFIIISTAISSTLS